MSTKNPLKLAEKADPDSIENMPGYVPPKQRKGWTPAEHCKFANAQLAWRKTNEYRAGEGLGPVRWVIRNKRIEITFA